MNQVTCPPDRIQTECCKVQDGIDPQGNMVYFLDLDYFLMTCPKCGSLAKWEKV